MALLASIRRFLAVGERRPEIMSYLMWARQDVHSAEEKGDELECFDRRTVLHVDVRHDRRASAVLSALLLPFDSTLISIQS